MQKNIFKKEYIALLEGVIKNNTQTISAPIARKANSIIQREVNKNGETAISHYSVLKRYSNYTLVKYILETGKTHQLRVHSSYIGHSILGDTLYGNGSGKISRQALHAIKVQFVHPITKKNVQYIAKIPNDILYLL